MLCISGFVDDVMFYILVPEGQNKKCFVDFARCRHRRRSFCHESLVYCEVFILINVTIITTDHFSGPGRSISPVCVPRCPDDIF